MTASVVAFFVLAVTMLALGLVALLRLGSLRLDSPLGIARDGFDAGERAPRWSLEDSRGTVRRVPAGHWQLLVFADHSIVEFPDLVRGLHSLASSEPDLEILFVSKGVREITELTFDELGIDFPVLHVDEAFYAAHNVRVLPYLMVIDGDGVARGSAVINYEMTLLNLWRLSHAAPADRRDRRLARPRG